MQQDKNLKKDYFWNAAGSAVYALSAAVLAFLVMHFAGPEDGGIFGFGFSTFGQQMFILAYFGIRPFHITDVSREYRFEDYRRLRILTSAAAVTAALLYLGVMMALGRYSGYKCLVILLLVLYKVADGAADLYESECQRGGMLWLGGQELTVRTVLAVASFTAVLILTKSLPAAAGTAVLVHAAVILAFRKTVHDRVLSEEDGTGAKSAGVPGGLLSAQVQKLARSTVLLFLSVFVDFYIFSASKYAIDMHLTNTDSGIFNILFMPTSVIYLVANFIIRPYMTRLADIYHEGDYPRFQKVIRLLALSIAGLGVLTVGGTLLVGRWILMLFELILGQGYYGMLISHHWDFVLIILGGCFYAVTCLFYYVLTIMRRQGSIFLNYLMMAVVTVILTERAVRGYGFEGAASAYPLYMVLTMFIFISSYRKELNKEKDRRDEEQDARTRYY